MPDADPQNSEARLRLRDTEVASRSFNDETIVLDLRSSNYLATNPAGTVLWRCLEKGATRSELVSALLEEFDVEEQRASTDVDTFLDECRRRGLLSD